MSISTSARPARGERPITSHTTTTTSSSTASSTSTPLTTSVIIAAFERPDQLQRLIDGLREQTQPPDEVIVVDDGSSPALAPRFPAPSDATTWRLLRQRNGGAGAARDAGIAVAAGDVVIIVDDDMIVPNDLISGHLAAHHRGRDVVQGRFVNRRSEERPLFDSFIDEQQQRYFDRCAVSPEAIEPARLATGNVSFRRSVYESAGGFDTTLRRREDSELGLRFAAAGVRFGFADGAPCEHDEPAESLSQWLAVAQQYGEAEVDIHERHLDHSPWDLYDEMPAAVRGLVRLLGRRPAALRAVGRFGARVGVGSERLGRRGVARRCYAVGYAFHWFAGVYAAFGPAEAAAALRARSRATDSATERAAETSTTDPTAVRIGSIDLDAIELDDAVDVIMSLTNTGRVEMVATPNVDHVMKCRDDDEFDQALANASLRVADGQPLVLISRLLRLPLRTKLSGSDMLTPVMKAAAAHGVRVFFFGSTEENAAVAEEKLRAEFPALDIVGRASPFYTLGQPESADFTEALELLRRSSAGLVVMAFGSPKQEVMVDRLRERLPAACYCCFGAALDFSAGAVRRAPNWASRLGVEWLWRLALEPKRLWKRYLVDDIGIVAVFARMTIDRLRRRSLLGEPSTGVLQAHLHTADQTADQTGVNA